MRHPPARHPPGGRPALAACDTPTEIAPSASLRPCSSRAPRPQTSCRTQRFDGLLILSSVVRLPPVSYIPLPALSIAKLSSCPALCFFCPLSPPVIPPRTAPAVHMHYYWYRSRDLRHVCCRRAGDVQLACSLLFGCGSRAAAVAAMMCVLCRAGGKYVITSLYIMNQACSRHRRR